MSDDTPPDDTPPDAPPPAEAQSAELALLRAKEGFLVPATRRIVKGGEFVRSDDPVVAGREKLFESADIHIERATRAPGEMRIRSRRDDAVIAQRQPSDTPSSRRPTKKAAPKKTAS